MDWLGTERWDFERAAEFVCDLGLKTIAEWSAYAESGKKPIGIPKHPHKAYSACGWTSWADWLGTLEVVGYLPFRKARKFVRSLKLKNVKQWRLYLKNGNRPANIPAVPYAPYKGRGWSSFGDWLGNGQVALNKRKFVSYEEFRQRIKQERENGRVIRGQVDFMKWARSKEYPADLPKNPQGYYSK